MDTTGSALCMQRLQLHRASSGQRFWCANTTDNTPAVPVKYARKRSWVHEGSLATAHARRRVNAADVQAAMEQHQVGAWGWCWQFFCQTHTPSANQSDEQVSLEIEACQGRSCSLWDGALPRRMR